MKTGVEHQCYEEMINIIDKAEITGVFLNDICKFMYIRGGINLNSILALEYLLRKLIENGENKLATKLSMIAALKDMAESDYTARLCLETILNNSDTAQSQYNEKSVYFALRHLAAFQE